METVDVIIPAYRPGKEFEKLLDSLSTQNYPVEKILVMNTEEKFWNTAWEKKFPKVNVVHLKKADFDHGGTRCRGARLSDSDIMVFMTQDAVPADRNLIGNLIRPLQENSKVGAAYARQLAREDCAYLEKYTRRFNYPETSSIKWEKDTGIYGIKTYFCSNVCAAYRRGVYLELGGFPHPVIFNEDLIFAAGAIQNGWKIIYKADARVIHSHEYTYRELIRRNFDQGVSQACHPEIFGKVKSEKEGIHLICTLVKKLLKERKYLQIIQLFVESGCKYLGYQMGKHYRQLPESFIMKLTMNHNYWRGRSDEDA